MRTRHISFRYAFAIFTGLLIRPLPSPALEITTTNLPAGLEGASYSFTLQASGGVAPLTWSVEPQGSAWGLNDVGQSDLPTAAAPATAASAGAYHTLVLLTDGSVLAAGDNSSGQCDVPAGLTGVASIAAGA